MFGGLRSLTAFGLAAALMASTAPALADVESKDPIKFTYGDWTTDQLNTEIMTRVLKKMGYNTETVPTEYLAQFPAVESGDVHVAMEIWFTTAKDQFEKTVADKKAVDLGPTGMQAIEDWWFPEYMKEQCPGLPDWKALNDCAAKFATADTGAKGRYVMGPESWGGFDKERVEALGLNWDVVYAGNDSVLNAEIKSAYERKAPVMAWVYAPNWTTIVYKGEWVKFPAYEDACYKDPKWGTNPDKAYDCGKPRGEIKKLGWTGAEAKWPKAIAAVKKFSITNDQIGAMAKEVDVDKKAVADVAQAWVDGNEAIWKKWTE
jgi:glycine betaine/proline transport system substrate-binding protein